MCPIYSLLDYLPEFRKPGMMNMVVFWIVATAPRTYKIVSLLHTRCRDKSHQV